MDWNILHFPIIIEETQETQKQIDVSQKQLTIDSIVASADYCLLNMHALGYEFLDKLIDWMYNNIQQKNWLWVNIDFILRAQYQVQSCSIFECKRLLKKIDTYITDPCVIESSEKEYFRDMRNIVFRRYSDIKDEIKNKTP